MLEAEIVIDDDLAVTGFKRALWLKAIRDNFRHYADNVLVVWIFIAITDVVLGEEHLVWKHFLFLAAFWVIVSAYGYYVWAKKIEEMKGWTLRVKLDEQGVIVSPDPEYRINWSHYDTYKEFDRYLQINAVDGTISFIPKTPQLFETIQFTKRHISAE